MSEPQASPNPAAGDGDASRGPIPLWAGRLIEPLYAAAIRGRNARFDRGTGVTRLDVPVISVGNLSVGGTGKTPMVMHIVATLLRARRSPCIAMRGYRPSGSAARHDHPPDETDSYRRRFPQVPVVAQPDRIAGLRDLMSGVAGPGTRAKFDCVVLDDGFQHRRLARDADVVLIDATRPPHDDRLLPAGWLREPVRSLARASSVVLTHAESVDQRDIARIDALVKAERPGASAGIDAVTRHVWTGLMPCNAGDSDDGPPLGLDALMGKRVVGCCAIGNPHAFFLSLDATVGAPNVMERISLPDHDPYEPATIDRLIRAARDARADAVVITDKDWSKLRRAPADRWPCPLFRPVLEIVFDRDGESFDRAILRSVGSPGEQP